MISKSGTGSVSCYDPIAGRFLSPDILVQEGGNTQSYNKYSYCLNNPLKYKDPGGYAWEPIRALRRNAGLAAAQELRMQQRLLNLSRGGVWPEISHLAGPNRLTMYGNNGDGGGICFELNQIAELIEGAIDILSNNTNERHSDNDATGEISRENAVATEENANVILPILINGSNITIYYKIENEEVAKANGQTEWTSYALPPHSMLNIRVDGINVDGTVYKIEEGYNYVIVNEDMSVSYDYQFGWGIFNDLYKVDYNFLYDQMWDNTGKRRYFEIKGNYYWDTRWYNLFFPNNQFPAP